MTTLKPTMDGIWQVRWSNPYTQPPEGRQVLAEVVIPDWPNAPDKRCPAELTELSWQHPGYGIHWTDRWHNKPDRSWSKARKGEARRRNLRKRIEAKWPMFAEMMIAEEMARYPSYYAGEEYNGRYRE
jgi:hypothetical protein